MQRCTKIGLMDKNETETALKIVIKCKSTACILEHGTISRKKFCDLDFFLFYAIFIPHVWNSRKFYVILHFR